MRLRVRTSIGLVCDAGFNIAVNNSGQLGTNTFIDPAFRNVTDLLASRNGAPPNTGSGAPCSGFTNVTACIGGYNAVTSTLTTPGVISDLTPTAGGTSGKGYQVPSLTCNTNADYPTWLKGIVYLHWTGTAVVQNFDLVTLQCGL